MIETQFISEGKNTIAVIMDYKEYLRLKEIEKDKSDYDLAMKTKQETKKWVKHDDLKKSLGID